MPSIVVVGAGPGLGTEIARRFGVEGYSVVISARNAERLGRTVAEMKEQGIDAHYVTMDLTDDASVAEGFAQARALVGEPDVLVFNPRVNYAPPYKAIDIDVATVDDFLKTSLLGAIRCTRQVLPAMLARGSGTLLYSVGASASSPVPMMAPVGVATAGVLNYADVLDAELAPQGILSAAVIVAVLLKADTPSDPKFVAELYWNAHARQAPRIQQFGSPPPPVPS